MTTASHCGKSEPSSYTAAFEGTDFYSATYAQDNLGRITQKVEAVEGTTHTYDYTYELTDRLKEVKKDGTVVSLYQYDDNGNRLSVTKSGTTVSGAYDDHNRDSDRFYIDRIRKIDMLSIYATNCKSCSKGISPSCHSKR